MVHSLMLRIYITWALILGSAEVLIIDQYSSGLFNCDTAMSKIFECRPVKNRTMRYAAVCVLSGNVAFGKNLIPYVDTCQSAMKSFVTRAFLPPHKTKISTFQFDLEAVDKESHLMECQLSNSHCSHYYYYYCFIKVVSIFEWATISKAGRLKNLVLLEPEP